MESHEKIGQSSSQTLDEHTPEQAGQHRQAIQDAHRRRAMDLLTLNDPNFEDQRTVEGGGLRSTWSPDHQFEDDIPPPRHSWVTFREQISKRINSSIFKPRKRKHVPWLTSLKALATCSCMYFVRLSASLLTAQVLNVLLVFIPVAWAVGITRPYNQGWHSHTLQFIGAPHLRTQIHLICSSLYIVHHSVIQNTRVWRRKFSALLRQGFWRPHFDLNVKVGSQVLLTPS
jgi:hypothetical protein